MTQIVVVIDGVPVLVVPIVWQRELKGTCHLNPVLFEPMLLFFASLICNQRTPCRHHLHHVRWLLQPPQEILYTVEDARDCHRSTDIPILKGPRHLVAWHHRRGHRAAGPARG